MLTVTVLAGGVAMFNNYQKMQQMESVIASVVPGGSVLTGGKQVEDMSGKGWADADSPDYVIEEAKGHVYPTTAPADESGAGNGAPEAQGAAGKGAAGTDAGAAQSSRESASEVIPETMPSGSGQAGSGTGSQSALSRGQSGTGSQSAPSGQAGSGAGSQGAPSGQAGSGAVSQSAPSGQGKTVSQSAPGAQGTSAAETQAPAKPAEPSQDGDTVKSGDKNSGAKDAASQVDYKVYTVAKDF